MNKTNGLAIKPFLKWAGGKYRIVDKILNELPHGIRFVEPFAGSAAVYLNASFKTFLICDINKDLIGLYSTLQKEGNDFIQYCKSFFVPENNTKDKFYELREQFNIAQDVQTRAALLLYLNRHAFNGLVRYNSKGAFNVPFGQYKQPYFPLDELKAFKHKTKSTHTEFVVKDFREIFSELKQGDVVYCDPPYVPLSATASFTTYAGNVFNESDQQILAQLASQAWAQGIPVILSNHDTTETRKLYSSATIRSFTVQRFISCNGNNRNAAPEILAIYR